MLSHPRSIDICRLLIDSPEQFLSLYNIVLRRVDAWVKSAVYSMAEGAEMEDGRTLLTPDPYSRPSPSDRTYQAKLNSHRDIHT